MPRERIYGSLVPFIDEDPARTVMEVTWSREAQYVQLASISIDGVTGEPLDIVQKHGCVTVSSEEREHECPVLFGGIYVQLDRRSINELIRKLRRARDQAFGRDE